METPKTKHFCIMFARVPSRGSLFRFATTKHALGPAATTPSRPPLHSSIVLPCSSSIFSSSSFPRFKWSGRPRRPQKPKEEDLHEPKPTAGYPSPDEDVPLFPFEMPRSTRKLGKPTIYHYPWSRSSHGAIRILECCELNPVIVNIVENPLSSADIERLMKELGIGSPRDFMRVHDPLYRELKLDDPTHSREDLVQALIKHPRYDPIAT